ncbi:MAG: hypothetical protein MI923_22070, partial [Phycisphaerales bacterium]|nr:hypothetical protein [Phycisphaerales bacterium]
DNKKQGITREPTPNTMTYIFTANRYVRATLEMPGPTEQRLVKHAKDKLKIALDDVNNFYQEVWPEYKKLAELVDISPFKDYTPLKMSDE